jgi:hypothetical protein
MAGGPEPDGGDRPGLVVDIPVAEGSCRLAQRPVK